MQSLLRPRLVCGPVWSAKTGSDVSLARVTGTHTAPVGDHRRVPKSLPEFRRSQLCTVVHGDAVCNGRDRKKQPKFKTLGADYLVRTRGSWIQVLPGAPIFKELRAASEAVSR